MLVTTKEMLTNARKNGYAVGAFNVENTEMIQAVVRAAEECRSPVILQTTPSTVRYGGLAYFFAGAKVAAERACVPVAIHLDHGDSFTLAVQAIREGYTSVMIDGSHGSFAENILLTKSVAAVAQPIGVSVEAELGKVGGKEDDLSSEGGFTDPSEAAEFVAATGVDSLAVAIGTAHGVYVGKPKLDKKRLAEIAKKLPIPLVLHGASGLTDEDITDCIARGIAKVNFATELRIAFSEGVKEVLRQKPDTFDPKAYLKAGRDKLAVLVKNRIALLGSGARA